MKIDDLGMKRVVILAVLLGINAAFYYGAFMFYGPQNTQQERTLQRTISKIKSLRKDVESMRVEYDQLQDRQGQFEELRDSGFFSSQSRRQAQELFNQIQDRSGVSFALANVQAGALAGTENTRAANHEILESEISIKLESVKDVDVFEYLDMVKKEFPGHVTLQSLNVFRVSDVSGSILNQISKGEKPVLIEADAQFVWRTMIPMKDKEGQR